jgi:predicted  nucleic acid-binding Zn-ribbon protein
VEKEFEKVKGALEEFGKKVVETVKKGKGEADKVTRTAQLRIETGSLNRQISDLYRELGELFYKNFKKPTKGSQDRIAETVTHIAEVEKKVASLNRQLKAVREDKSVPRRGRPPKEKAAAPKRRGRPPKAATAETAQTAPKRRGRPPKVKTG